MSVSFYIVLQCVFADFLIIFPINTWKNFEFAVLCFEFAVFLIQRRQIEKNLVTSELFEFAVIELAGDYNKWFKTINQYIDSI